MLRSAAPATLASIAVALVALAMISVAAADEPRPLRIPVEGGTAEQQAATRAVLGAMGEPRSIKRVRLPGAGARIELKPGVSSNPAKNREAFIAQVIAGELLERLATTDGPIQRAVVAGVGQTLPFFPSETRPTLTPEQLRALIRNRAPRVAKVTLRRVRAYPVSIGAVEIVAALSSRQILEGREGGVLERLLPRGSAKAARLTLVTEQGARLSSRGFIGNLGFGSDGSSPTIRSPELPSGPTRLSVTFTQRRADGSQETTRVNLDCETRTGARDAGQLCDTLRAHWLRFLPSPAPACLGIGRAFSVRIAGVFAAVPIDRDSERCTGIDAVQWAQFLSVPVPAA